jgi:hypothetical protein
MRHTSSTSQPPAVLSGLLVALLILTGENGAWTVVGALTKPHFAPEVGPLLGFIIMSFALAAYFVPPFLLLACPFLWLARPASVRRPWPICALAALLVAGTASFLNETLRDSRTDTIFIAALALLPAGIGASVVLRRWRLSSPRGDQLHEAR